jgi:hypothetical protein
MTPIQRAASFVFWHIELILVALILLFGAFLVGYRMASTRAACHAPTEDSVILDCDWRDEGWYRK